MSTLTAIGERVWISTETAIEEYGYHLEQPLGVWISTGTAIWECGYQPEQPLPKVDINWNSHWVCGYQLEKPLGVWISSGTKGNIIFIISCAEVIIMPLKWDNLNFIDEKGEYTTE